MLEVSRPVQDNQKHFVGKAEMDPLLPDTPKQGLVFLLEQSDLRDDCPL